MKVLNITHRCSRQLLLPADGLARQLGAVHEEQQGDGGDGQGVEPADELAACRQERSQQHGGDQRTIGQESRDARGRKSMGLFSRVGI